MWSLWVWVLTHTKFAYSKIKFAMAYLYNIYTLYIYRVVTICQLLMNTGSNCTDWLTVLHQNYAVPN